MYMYPYIHMCMHKLVLVSRVCYWSKLCIQGTNKRVHLSKSMYLHTYVHVSRQYLAITLSPVDIWQLKVRSEDIDYFFRSCICAFYRSCALFYSINTLLVCPYIHMHMHIMFVVLIVLIVGVSKNQFNVKLAEN